MSILNRLHQIIESDVAKLFGAAKKASIVAGQEVEHLTAQLEAANQRAIAAATEAKAHAEAAADRARAAARELEIEAKSAAERVAFHTSQLERKDPS
jgi:alkylated DNA nucleotide flippase Atl1